MSRFTEGTQPSHTPVDYGRISNSRLGKLGLPEDNPALQCAKSLVKRTRTEPSAISYAQESAFWLRWCRDRGLEPLAATIEDVEEFGSSNARYAMGTQHLKLLVVRLLFKIAIARGLAEANPVVIPHTIRRDAETNTPALSKAHAQQLFASIAASISPSASPLTGKRDLALTTVMTRLCLRTSEAADLRWGRIRRSAGIIQLSFLGKGRKAAHLPVPEDVWLLLTAWKRAFERATGTTLGPNDPVFLGVSTRDLKTARVRGGGRSPLVPMSRGTIYRVINERLRDIGIEGERYGGHCLRATGAVLSIEGGSTLIEVKQLLRHSSIDTTMRYLQKLTLEASIRAIENIRLVIPRWDEESDQDESPLTPVAA